MKVSLHIFLSKDGDCMTSYYVSKKSFSLWFAVFCILVSSVTRVSYFMNGNVHNIGVYDMVAKVVIPVAATVILIGILCICGERFFKATILPVVMGCIFFMLAAVDFSKPAMIFGWIFCVALGFIYISVIYNKIKTNTLLVYIFGFLTAYNLIFVMNDWYSKSTRPQLLNDYLPDISIFLMVLGMLFLSMSMKRDFGEHTLKWSDRSDGRRLRTLPAMAQIEPYIMPERSGACNLIREKLDLEEIEQYIADKRAEGLKGFGLMHVLIAAYLRATAQYPAINRYLAGQKVYSRFGCIIALTIKKSMSIESPDTVIKVKFEPGDTAKDVYEKFTKAIEENKGDADDSDFDNVAKYLTFLPGIFLKFTVWTLKLMDYFGLLPTVLEDVSPFHASMFITSMGSLGIPAIYHHLYNFGNVPIFFAFGKKYKEKVIGDDGFVYVKKYVDYTVTTDERICDGYYFAQALKQLKKYLANPQCLDEKAEIVEDIK